MMFFRLVRPGIARRLPFILSLLAAGTLVSLVGGACGGRASQEVGGFRRGDSYEDCNWRINCRDGGLSR